MTLVCHCFFSEDFIKYYTAATQSAFICSKSIMETPEQCVKPVQSEQYRHRNDVQDGLNNQMLAGYSVEHLRAKAFVTSIFIFSNVCC